MINQNEFLIHNNLQAVRFEKLLLFNMNYYIENENTIILLFYKK